MKIIITIEIPDELVDAARPMARRFSIPIEKFIRFHAVRGALCCVNNSATDSGLTLYCYTFPNRESAMTAAQLELGDFSERTELAVSYMEDFDVVGKPFNREELGLPPARPISDLRHERTKRKLVSS
jgi:hypothetical protein